MAKSEDDKDKPKIDAALGLGGIFKGLGNFLEMAAELAQKAEKLQTGTGGNMRVGTFGSPKGLQAVYGVSVRVGAGRQPVVERFGNLREKAGKGPAIDDVREPIADLLDENDHFLVVAELPGVDESAVSWKLKDDVLLITGESGERKYYKELLVPSPGQRGEDLQFLQERDPGAEVVEAEGLLKTEDCLYLYGVTRNASLDLSGVKGIEGGCEVWMVSGGDLACVVSPVPRAQYNQEEISVRSQELDWIAPRAVRHHEVLQHLRQAGVVVPLKFGSLCSSVNKVKEILRDERRSFLHLLHLFEGREEWGVKVYVNEALVIRAIENAENGHGGPELRPASEGEAYFLKKKKRQLLSDQMSARLSALGDEVYEFLRPGAADGRKGPYSGSSKPSQLVILSTALLVDQQQFADLRKRIEALEADCRSYGMTVELDGPWVPYSFCEDLAAAATG